MPPKVLLIFPWLLLAGSIQGQTCALDVFVANDQSGSVDAIENVQSRLFISAFFTGLQPWGAGAGESRMAIADWDSPGVWQQFSYPSVGQNYTTLLSDVLAYQTAPRALIGGTDPYTALLSTYQQIGQTAVPGRVATPVIVLMTDAVCVQVPAATSALATQIKNAGVYIIVVAVEAAAICPNLAGTNVASPGGYFSAPNYSALVQQNVALVQAMINAGCNNSFDPSYDLDIVIDGFTATGCNTGLPNYTVDYTVTNNPAADFNGPLVISFYNGDPALATTSLLAVQNAGPVNLPVGTSYSGSLTSLALGAANVLYAVVNYDGAAPGNAPPFYVQSGSTVVADEWVTFNNVCAPEDRVNDPITCPPQAIITADIVGGGVGCNDLATFEITICNTGDASAWVTPTLPISVPGAVMVNNVYQNANYTVDLDWATYHGGNNSEEGNAVAIDPAGNIYMAGTTRSTGAISTAGAHQTVFGGNRDAFLAKFTPAGVRLWATFYGGANGDRGLGVTTDAAGNVYLVGHGSSATAMATAGSHQSALGGSDDAFIVKFNSAGVRQWASYYGGAGVDIGYSVVADAAGNVYMAGTTSSATAIATAGAHQTVFGGGEDQFMVKFNAVGVRQWGTYYGGADDELWANLAVDPTGFIILTGETTSPTGIATAGAFQAAYVADEVYVAKFSTAGVRQWGTYFGGLDVEETPSVACDASGNIYLAGVTGSDNAIATAGAHQVLRVGSREAFLAKFSATGARQWGTYIGDGNGERMRDVTVDLAGRVIVAGGSNSTAGIATLGAYQTVTTGGNDDAFIMKFTELGVRLWGTYFGGNGNEEGNSVAIDNQGNIYLCGLTESNANVATTGAHQAVYGGGEDAYLAKFIEVELPILLLAGECIVRQYTIDYSAVAAGTYNLSMGIIATVFTPGDATPLVLPDQNFNAGTFVGISGFNGAVHISDNVTVPAIGTACPPGDQISIALNIPIVSSCANGNYAQATVTINNTSGTIAFNTDLHLNLTGVGSAFAGEPFNLTAGLLLATPNVLDPAYPAVPNALLGQTGNQYLPILEIPPGISTFTVDINIGSTLTNLSAQIENISSTMNLSGQTNLATDAAGVMVLPYPGITGFGCPGSINAGGNIVFGGISVTGAASVLWASSTVAVVPNGGTVAAPLLTYMPTPMDLANGFAAISLTATSAGGCETTVSCQVDIENVPYDYGDAPIVYDMNVNYQPPAAASTLFGGLVLGFVSPGTEALANNSVMADGDGTEEDALTTNPWADPWPPPGSGYILPTRATNSSASKSYLHAYVDWNADGDFLDSLESSLNTITIPALAGSAIHSMQFTVPPFVNTGSLFYIRIRLSVDSMSVTVPYMAAPRGETEDYVWASVGPLPIELLFFDGVCGPEGVDLHWATATELNSELFTVERSLDGSAWSAIGTVPGAGNSQQTTHYEFRDLEAPDMICYYRLEQTDYDGAYSFSPTVAVQPCGDKEVVGQWLLDAQGRVCRTWPVVDGSLADGIYLVRVEFSDGAVQTTKVAVQ